MSYQEVPVGTYISDAETMYNTYSSNGTYLIMHDANNWKEQTFISNIAGVRVVRISEVAWPEVKMLFGIYTNNAFEACYMMVFNKPFTCYYARDDFGRNPPYGNGTNESAIKVVDGDSYYLAISYNTTGASAEISVTPSGFLTGLTQYDSVISAIEGSGIQPIPSAYPITYRLTNCTADGAPTEAAVGDTVTVTPTFPENYGIINPSTDIYVMCNGVIVPSTYTDGTLSFTMPDPS